jgi:hypothetical protein
MSAEIISLSAWKAMRKTGSRRLDPIRDELRERRAELANDQRWIRSAEEKAAQLQNRLEENVTRQGPNKGGPLSEANRYQIANKQKNLLELIEAIAGSTVEICTQIQELEEELARGQRESSH